MPLPELKITSMKSLPAMDLAEPVRKRQLGLVAVAGKDLQHPLTIIRLDEDVDVLRLARHVRVMRERKVRRRAGTECCCPCSLPEGLDVELRARIVNCTVRLRFP